MKDLLTIALYLSLIIGLSLSTSGYAAEHSAYQQAAQLKIQEAHQANCDLPLSQSALEEVMCKKRIRFAVRSNYHLFGAFDNYEFKGFEIDLAKLLASRLGVQAEFIIVTATNRIEKLINREVDIVLATMSHTRARGSVIHFIRPHYYASPTTIVGPKYLNIHHWGDLKGKSICVPAGNFSNIAFAQHRVRVLIYDRPERMIDALRLGACQMIAHDRSLLLANVIGPKAPEELSIRFNEKFSFNDVPWGMGVLKEAQEDLGAVLALLMADLHQSGTLQSLAQEHDLDIGFLEEQKVTWSRASCFQEQSLNDACFVEPSNLSDPPTKIEPFVRILENSLSRHTDTSLKFPMLTGENASNFFIKGLLVSVLIVIGSIVATLAFAFLFYKLLRSPFLLTRIAGNIITQFFQNSPIILLLTLGYLVVTFLTSYGPIVAVLVSIVVIGLNNGANGGSAMNETAMSFKAIPPTLIVAKDSNIQLRAAIINAAKASPVAAFIGAPELLTVLTDITSFSGERTTTYVILSIFYLSLIQIVVMVSGRLTARLKKNA
jgi:ABC-type amino acid transport substrate-binding protein/ABC-type amino acid transport system permease subunit